MGSPLSASGVGLPTAAVGSPTWGCGNTPSAFKKLEKSCHAARLAVSEDSSGVVTISPRPVASMPIMPPLVFLSADQQRSEEHTSELYSPMRSSYAVFGL